MPLNALRAQIASAIDVVIQLNRLNDGRSGICFMSHRGNDLRSLVTLVAAAATPCAPA